MFSVFFFCFFFIIWLVLFLLWTVDLIDYLFWSSLRYTFKILYLWTSLVEMDIYIRPKCPIGRAVLVRIIVFSNLDIWKTKKYLSFNIQLFFFLFVKRIDKHASFHFTKYMRKPQYAILSCLTGENKSIKVPLKIFFATSICHLKGRNNRKCIQLLFWTYISNVYSLGFWKTKKLKVLAVWPIISSTCIS